MSNLPLYPHYHSQNVSSIYRALKANCIINYITFRNTPVTKPILPLMLERKQTKWSHLLLCLPMCNYEILKHNYLTFFLNIK